MNATATDTANPRQNNLHSIYIQRLAEPSTAGRRIFSRMPQPKPKKQSPLAEVQAGFAK
jgi:hypothetical protein